MIFLWFTAYLVEKAGPSYPDDKYGMVRPSSHVVHGGPIPIQQPPPVSLDVIYTAI